MAERRRRRSTECDSETEHAVLSEQDSNADESREVEEAETESDEYVTEEEETAEEDEGEEGDGKEVADGERQSGDGEEQPKLDDDEDRQNPAYIPRRGAFYEHDMRLDPNDEVKEAGDQEREEKRGKGKLWKDESKWLHDRFDAYDQAPKSRQELVTMYGYDITQYDEPPEEAPKIGGRSRGRGGRDRKPQFQDFLPDSGKDRRNFSNDDEYNDRGPRQSNRGFSRGRRSRGRSDGGQSRRNYSDFKDDRAPRNRGFSDRERDFQGHDQDNYGNRDNFRGRDSHGDRDRGNFGRKDRGSFGNDEQYERDGGYGNRGSRGQFNNRDNRGSRNTDFNDRDRPSNRGGSRGGRGRGRGEVQDNRRYNRRDRDNYSQQNESRSNRDNANYDRQYSGDNMRNRDNYERQNSGGRDRQNYERQSSGGRDNDGQFRKQNEGRSRVEPEQQHQEFSSNRFSGNDSQSRIPTRSYDKPTPKSYYTLSVTDDEKVTGDMEDGEISPPAKSGISDLNVTVTGDRRSFNKDRSRLPRSQEYSQQTGGEDKQGSSTQGPGAAPGKHQPTLPPRLQQQQQQHERKRQKQQQQQQQQQGVSDKQDSAQSRGNKRYSSQRQRPMPEGPGFSEPQISQPTQQIATSQVQQQFQPNFSSTKPGSVQPSVIVRPTISQQISTPPRQPSVGSPTMVIPGVPPPQSMIPVPGQVGQARPPRPPPQAAPQQMGTPPVFAPGTMPSTVMPAVSVIGAPLINPAGMIYAAPPPAFQVPVPQFTGAAAAAQSQQPGETVRGGTTYYPQASAGTGATPGTTYYSPEMQMSKQNRVQVRRPKVPLPIVNPEDIKHDKGGEAACRDDEDDDDQYLDDSGELIEPDDIKQEPDDSIGSVDGVEDQLVVDSEQTNDGGAASSEIKTQVPEIEMQQVKLENVSDENVSNSNENSTENVDRTETLSNEVTASIDSQDDSVGQEKSVTAADRPAELGVTMDKVEQTAEDSDKATERSSTFVVKTEVLTPTLSVSTSIKPDKLDENQDSSDTSKGSSAIKTEQEVEFTNNVETHEENVDVSDASTKPEKEENEDFEDAVESVN